MWLLRWYDEYAGRRKRKRFDTAYAQEARTLQNEVNRDDLEYRERHPPAGLNTANREGVGRNIQGSEKTIQASIHIDVP